MSQFKRFNTSDNTNWSSSDAYPDGTLTWDPNNGLRLHDGNTSGGNSIGGGSDSWKTWSVAGQDSLIATANDTVEFVAENGIEISTNSTNKTITFSGSQIEIDGGDASTVYTAEITVDGGGA